MILVSDTVRLSPPPIAGPLDGVLLGALRRTPALLVLLAPDGRIRTASAAAQELLGRPPEDLAGRELAEALHPEDRGDLEAGLVEVDLSQRGVLAAVRLADGSRSQLLLAPLGPAAGMVAFLIPIVEGRALPPEARTAAAAPADATATLPDDGRDAYLDLLDTGLLVTDASGVVRRSNAAARALLRRDDLLGVAFHDLVHPDAHDRCPLVEYPPGTAVDDVWYRADGTALRVRVRSTLGSQAARGYAFADAGPPLRRERDLVRARQRYRALFAGAPLGVAELDAHGAIRRANPRLADLLGTSADALTGQGLDDLLPEGSAPALAALRRALAQGRSKREAELVGANGSAVPVTLFLVPDPDADGVTREHLLLVTESPARVEPHDVAANKALHDPLTGLPGRELILDRLRHALRSAARDGSRIAVLFCDLDRFKDVNDSLGHDTGDRLLAVLGGRLSGALRGADSAGRIGGDEFVVLCTGVVDVEGVTAVAERIHAAITEPVTVDGRTLQVSVSIGITLAGPGDEAAAVLRSADVAMYRAKERGARWEVYDERLGSAANERATLARALAEAIANRALTVAWDPIVTLPGRQLVGRELAPVWTRGAETALRGGALARAAEGSGLALQLGEWMLSAACSAAPEAAASGAAVHVDLPGGLITRDRFAAALGGLLEAGGIDPRALVLEISEGTLQRIAAVATPQLRALGRQGVRVVVDHVGHGALAPMLLRRLPVQAVKLSTELVHAACADADARAVVAAVVGMARGLDMAIAAEGVDSREDADLLGDLGVTLVQGAAADQA